MVGDPVDAKAHGAIVKPHVIASAAKQSSFRKKPPLDCFVAPLLAMTNETG